MSSHPRVSALATMLLLSSLGCDALLPSTQDPLAPAVAGQFKRAQPLEEIIIGAPDADELLGGMVLDREDNMYFSANGSGLVDRFGMDLMVGRVNADGQRAWVKVLSTDYTESSPDAGQNNETGGVSQSIAIDEAGDVYVVGAMASSKTPNHFRTLLFKLKGDSGQLVWAKLWAPGPTPQVSKTNAAGYGLDVAGGKVRVIGTTGADQSQGEAYVSILSFDADSGDYISGHALEINETYTDRGYVIKAVPGSEDSVYIAGNGNARAWVGLVEGVEREPTIGWLKQVELGIGGNINGLALDQRGDLYLACDRRGAETFFSGIKLNPKGELQWGRTFKGRRSDRNNINGVHVSGDHVLLTGRTGQEGFDVAFGDGLIVALDLEGSLRWATMHFSGKGDDEAAEHRVKAAYISRGHLYVATQAGTRKNNSAKYVGDWLEASSLNDGEATLEPYEPALTELKAKATLLAMPQASAVDLTQALEPTLSFADAPTRVKVQPATLKQDGSPPDEDILLSKLKLTP